MNKLLISSYLLPRHERVVFGIAEGAFRQVQVTHEPYLYADHSYFMRGWHNGHVRVIRNAVHLTRIVPGPTDRLAKFGVKIQPYRKDGRHILVLCPGRVFADVMGVTGKAEALAEEVKKYTDRPVIVREKHEKNGELQSQLDGAWAVISVASVGAVEAAIAGIPVFSTSMCPSWPVNAGELKDIDRPAYPERYEWANSLAWASWHFEELPTINYGAYQCE